MKKFVAILFVLAMAMARALAQQAENDTFVGMISDSMCGLEHPAGMGTDKECTLMCIKGGSKYVLADATNKVIYQLDDQKSPEKFAGQKVKITGTLDKETKTIKVKSIESAAAEPNAQ
jgi:uncharacterized protein YdeI (BOF family)